MFDISLNLILGILIFGSVGTYVLRIKLTFYVIFKSYLTLRLLISYIYGAPSKARNANIVYIWTYVWQR